MYRLTFTGAVFFRLYTVDPSTGAILNTVELDQLLHNSMAFDAKDVLYSHQWEGPGVRIYAVDPVTGSTNGLPAKIPQLIQGGGEIDISTIDF